MFDHKRIKEAFAPLVGIRQNDNPEFGELSPSLLYTGDNVQLSHPLINIENLDMCARNYGKYSFTAYNAGTTYAIGDRVTDAGINYEAIAASTGATPASSPLSWKVLNLLDLFLQDVWSNAAEDTVNEVVTKKKLAGVAKTLLSSLKFFEGAGSYTDTIINEGALVGVKIELNSWQNILVAIDQIGLQLSVPQVAPLILYLYHSSQLEPIATLSVSHNKTISFAWHTSTFKLNYFTSAYDRGGVFFLMYDQDNLTGQAIKKRHNFHTAPCGWCNTYDVNAFRSYSKYINVHSVRVKAADRNTTDPLWLWDITKTEHTPDNNWGLNFAVSVRCDLTDFIILNKTVFQYAYRDMITKKLLEMMANSTRQNHLQTKVDQLARLELTAPVAGGMGFIKQLDEQLKAVNFEVSGLDDLCMPCAANKAGLKVGTAALSFGH